MLQQRLLLQKIVLSLVNLGALTTRTQADVAIQRAGARALLLGKTIWVYGGFSNNLQNPLNTAATLDVSVPWSVGSPAWKERADDPTVAPFSQFGTMFPTTDQTGFYLSDQYGGTNKTYGMAKFDATNYKWTILPVSNFSVLPPSGNVGWDNSGNAWVWMGTESSLISGEFMNDTTDAFKFNQSTQSWTQIPSQLPKVLYRRLHRISWLPSGLLVLTGGFSPINLTWISMSEVPVYNTMTGAWLATTSTGAIPMSRHSHSVTVAPDGHSIILYGGLGEWDVLFGDVAVLDTRTFIWTAPTISGTVPTPRIKHTAVQVGDVMFVMGGAINANLTLSSSIISETIVLNTTTWSWLTTYTPANWPNVTSSSNPQPVTATAGSSTSSGSPDVSASGGIITGITVGAIVGIIVGAIAACFMAGLFFSLRQRRQRLAQMGKKDDEQAKENGDGLLKPDATSSKPSEWSDILKPHDPEEEKVEVRGWQTG